MLTDEKSYTVLLSFLLKMHKGRDIHIGYAEWFHSQS